MSAHIADTKNRPFDVSLIVPFLNEKENLPDLCRDITKHMHATGLAYEVILIDDGSTDGSDQTAQDLARDDTHIKLIRFTRNFGQTAAMAAGFRYARGRIYVALDADNQNDPADIGLLLKKIEEGYDVVSGWRKNRKDLWLTRRLPSSLANALISKITGVHLRDYGCSLKAYRAEYIDAVGLYGEMHRFIPAYASMVGAKVVEVAVNHRPRTRGVSKYTIARTFKVIMDLITVKFLSHYATKPSYLFGGIGFLLCFGGIASGLEVLVEKFAVGTFAHRNPFLLLAVFLFILGVQLVLMGLIAELLVRTYHESQGKPTYLISRTVNMSDSGS